MFPPTKVSKPQARKISPVRVVVVVLPLVPVMATMGAFMNQEASSTSLTTRRFCARAMVSGLMSIGTPGLTTIRSAIRKL